ncbi:MAG: hypothetical protein GY865_08115 [candidate division Zixibacteria bacterium]|nr:hypothetical protein [candidate division Zixibacteria bacterium]
MSRLETLKKLESTLQLFLTAVAQAESDQFETLNSINTLDDIARDSQKGRYINNRLGNWMAKNRILVDDGLLKKTAISAVGNLLSDIKNGLDTTDPESKKLFDEIDSWFTKGVVPGRKVVLSRPPEISEPDLADKYFELIKKESEQLSYYMEKGDHILSMLDDILKSAEAKNDPLYLHMAGSIIYYLKNKGYKIEPYVRKLRFLEKGAANAK